MTRRWFATRLAAACAAVCGSLSTTRMLKGGREYGVAVNIPMVNADDDEHFGKHVGLASLALAHALKSNGISEVLQTKILVADHYDEHGAIYRRISFAAREACEVL